MDAHCHAFQRALRGRTEGGDFWAWREEMLAEAERQTPELVRASYAETYRELRARRLHGGRRVPLSRPPRGARGARRRRGGGDRDRAAPLGVRARRAPPVPPGLAGRLPARARGAARARREGRRRPPLRPRVPARLARGARPLRRRSRACRCTSTPTSSPARSRSAWPSTGCARSSCSTATGCLGPHTTVVHATHADGHELDLLAAAGARICACPTTEANLGDGFLPVERVLTRGIALCIGSDSNVRIDPLEELRELEGIARRQSGRRNVLSVEALLSIGADGGRRGARARALGRRQGRPLAPLAARRRRSARGARPRLQRGGASAASARPARRQRQRPARRRGAQRLARPAATPRPVRGAGEVRVRRVAAAHAVGARVARVARARGEVAAGSICVPSFHSL